MEEGFYSPREYRSEPEDAEITLDPGEASIYVLSFTSRAEVQKLVVQNPC